MKQIIKILKKRALVSMFVLSCNQSLIAQVSFAHAGNYTAGAEHYSIFSADFNGDGKMDLATTNYSGNSVSVLLGSGTGTFAPAVNYGTGTGPYSLFSADFNGDGNMDLATANSNGDNISVLLGNGTGTFAPAVNYGVAPGPRSVFSADFNGDGKMDLATANGSSNSVSVLLGNGTGTFAPRVNYVTGTSPRSVFSSDFNGDGNMDLATANNIGNNVSVLLGSSTGTFAPAVGYAVGLTYPVSISSADFNSDGNMDLAIGSTSSGSVSVLLGSSTGTFAPAVKYHAGQSNWSVFSADFNGDGNMDLAGADYSGDWASVLLGSSTGTFVPAGNYYANNSPLCVFSADFNGDGKMDLATANYSNSNNITILLNTTPGAALNFDGVNDYATTGTGITNALFGFNTITIEAWVKPSNTIGIGSIVGNYNVPTNNSQMQFLLRRNGDNYEFYIGNGSGGSFSSVVSSSIATANVWQHVSGTWDGAVARLYVNGVLSNTATIIYPAFGAFANEVWIGGQSGAEFFSGSIDEVRVWNRTLCHSEIQNNMNGQLSLPQNNLIAYYQFNEGNANVENPSITNLTALVGPTGTLLGPFTLNGTVSNWVFPGGVNSTTSVTAFVSPTISIAGVNSICRGSSTTFTASGVSTYSWTSGPNNATFAVTPSVTTIYSVVGTAANGCLSDIATKSIIVNPTPTVTVNSGTICIGETFTIIPSGAITYTIEGGTDVVSPLTNTTYSIQGQSSNGCDAIAISSVQVNQTPILNVSTTNTVCEGSSIILQVSGANTYSWSNGANTATTSIMPTTNTIYSVTGTDNNNCSSTETISVSLDNTCQDVWPGDANSDGVANNLDILELGLHFNQTGTQRSIISNSWQSYYSNNWAGTISNGKNVNHSDCNGDGTINDDDTLAIYNNYGLVHAFKHNQNYNSNSQVKIIPDESTLAAGSWGSASIYLGDVSTPISNINGLAFTLNYDNNLIEPNQIYLEYENSFFDSGQNLKFRKTDFANNKLYTATTHTTNNNVSGHGLIAKLHYQLKSSLTNDEVLNIGITEAYQSDASGTIISLTSGSSSVQVGATDVGVEEFNNNGVYISPNPTSGDLIINSKSQLQKIEIVTITGQLLLTETPTHAIHKMNLEHFTNGIYFINVYQNNQVIKREKIVLTK